MKLSEAFARRTYEARPVSITIPATLVDEIINNLGLSREKINANNAEFIKVLSEFLFDILDNGSEHLWNWGDLAEQMESELLYFMEDE